jgi:hypothetical protein
MPSEKRRRLLGRLIHKAETLRRTLDVGVKSDTVRKTRRAWVTSAKGSLAAEFEDTVTAQSGCQLRDLGGGIAGSVGSHQDHC